MRNIFILQIMHQVDCGAITETLMISSGQARMLNTINLDSQALHVLWNTEYGNIVRHRTTLTNRMYQLAYCLDFGSAVVIACYTLI